MESSQKVEHHNHHKNDMGILNHNGHDHNAMIKDFKKRFYVVLLLTVPIMLISPMIKHWLNLHWEFNGSNIVLSILSSIVFFYGGWPFLKGWISELKKSKPGMMTLIGFAISVAYFYSLATVLGLKGMDFFWELSTLILIMLLGHWIEMRSIAGASRELELLVQLMPSDAHLVHGEHIMDVSTQNLKSNDIIIIKPGEKVAADGVVIEGDTDHYEYVCQYVTNGISHLSAISTTPIIFGILTTQNEELAFERAAIDRMNKGKEFAETALFMINAFDNI